MKRRDFLAAGAATLALSALPGWAADLKRFKLGVITDEVTNDVEKAFQWVKGFGLEWVELRNIWGGKYITEATPDDVKRVKDLLEQYHLRVSVLDSAYFKVTLPGTQRVSGKRDDLQQDTSTFQKQGALLERAIGRAKDLGTDKVRIFAFWRVADPQAIFDRVAKELEKAAAIAQREGIRLVLENEPACNVATAVESVAMLKAVKSPALGLNWDPGNAYMIGEQTPFPDGYAMLDKKRIWHMHLKDAQLNDAGKPVWRPVLGGKIDYVGQFRAALKDGYQGTMSLETHYQNAAKDKEASSRESMNGILEAIRKA
jgi:sugar phosphate isomerase/epimerase